MTAFINQYKLLFLLSWIFFYLIYPAWALPVSVSARAFVFLGLILFFCISAFFMNRWFNVFIVDKPVIVWPANPGEQVKSHLWLVILCALAVALHIYRIFSPILIMGDEAMHIQGGLMIYEYIDIGRHKIFQVAFWTLIVLVLVIKKFNGADNHLIKRLSKRFCGDSTNHLLKFVFGFLITGFLVSYFLLLKDITYLPALIRYPPLSRFLYFISYSAFGITHIGPRMLQLTFYVLSAVYLYRTIALFSDRKAALTGASIYLFLPVSFVYAGLAELGCGTVFFITLISFHFLRFVKENDNRDLLLTSYFIGMGFLYKRSILLMLFVCTAFLIISKIKNKDLNFSIHLKVILLSSVSIVPWMVIGKFFSWRNYNIIWSNFRPFEGKVFTYFMNIPLDISWVLFLLFLSSVIFILLSKRNALTFYFGILFIAYYFFLALDIAYISPRLAMAFYPTIAVYLALFLYTIIEKIRWKHSFKLLFFVLTAYLIAISTVPPLNAQFLSSSEFKKLEYFPGDKAMKWVKDNVKDNEKILTLRIMSALFYRDKYSIDRNKIINFWYELYEVSTPEKLKAFCKKNKISYIMFPAPLYLKGGNLKILEYLKENREEEFLEVKRFNLDGNYIIIYKLKKDL
ncbi:MAG TPA: hypothetical protein ENG83_01040 [Nitrospirae bacterium]|nr:hypothetical protein BMS3Abin06_02185 [bacterium BMS3Abin06]HDH10787.1 hypothetical protein [Nitrospirota bacterium]HDZ00969.1 hypothetical protein [Nitrospirota bacterium]